MPDQPVKAKVVFFSPTNVGGYGFANSDQWEESIRFLLEGAREVRKGPQGFELTDNPRPTTPRVSTERPMWILVEVQDFGHGPEALRWGALPPCVS
jgi:hypothetical protein